MRRLRAQGSGLKAQGSGLGIERDPQLRRIERTGVIACAAIALVGAVTDNGWRSAAAVVGGGALIAMSYGALRAAVDAAMQLPAAAADQPDHRRASRWWRLVKYITRYAILAGIAYVMMVRLRAQPMWMLAGATSLVAAVMVEAVRQFRTRC